LVSAAIITFNQSKARAHFMTMHNKKVEFMSDDDLPLQIRRFFFGNQSRESEYLHLFEINPESQSIFPIDY